MERNARHTDDYTDADRAAAPVPRGAGTFVYASGARPLEGYTIKRGVGQGGFGEIYYATSDAGKEVALKLVRRNLEVELRGMRQCLNLKHPNLVDLYDIRQDEQGNTWVVMEFVAGQSLEDALAERPDGFPVPEAMAWMHGIAAGVAYLHDRGIVHRDLKPGNIFCEGVVKIGDYGLSKFISSSRRSGHTESIGTVHYMAPEVANGRYGKEIDIYALGVILFELLSGRVPFDGESVGEVLMKHLTAQPDLSMLEEPYRSIVARALEKDPARRFGSVAEMMAALPPPPGGGVVGWIPGGASAGGPSTASPNPSSIPPVGEPPLAAEVLPDDTEAEEPVWRFMRERWQRLRLAWDRANLSLPRKMGVLFLAVVAFFLFAGYLIPLAFIAGLAYLGYRLVRPILVAYYRISPPRAKQQPPPQPTAHPAAAVPVRPVARWPQARTMAYRSAEPAPPIVRRSFRQRVTELIGSLVVGALVAMAMSVVVILIDSYWKGNVRPQQFAWLVLMGIAGTWSVLVVSKFWEYSSAEPLLRRFVLMLVGLGLGLASFAVAGALLVDLPPQDASIPTAQFNLPQSFYDAAGRPLAMAHMAVFGTLLALLRWWNQTDPQRRSRLSLGSILFAVVGAAVAAGAWQFPQPWLILVAVVMSAAVQLASPWLPPRARLRPQRKTVV